MAREILKCQCGQRLTRPIPGECPKCGAKILGVRKSSLSPLVLTLISIVVMVGLLLLLILFLFKTLE